MQTWKWLYAPRVPFNWRFVRNVIVKAALLFAALNLLWAAASATPALGRVSLYNTLLPGRARLPYGENPAASLNLSLYDLNALFASHALAGGDAGEFRVLLIGDSSVWGILLRPEETLAGQINAADLRAADGRPVRAYNLGYPTMSLVKDLLLLDEGLRYAPDLVVWLFTLESFGQAAQLESALVQNNAARVRRLIRAYDLDQNPDDPRLVTPDFWDRTIIGQRRPLADWLRLQLYGVAWALTGVDQDYPADYKPRAIDLPADPTWHGLSQADFTPADLAFDVLAAGVARAGTTPILLINEPIFISQGANSDLRYDAFYPRWAYDAYRAQLHARGDAAGWPLLDLWDALPAADCYTDSAVHLTPACSGRLAQMVGEAIRRAARVGGREVNSSQSAVFSLTSPPDPLSN